MTWLYLTIPLMLLAIGIATVPVLYYTIREHRLIHGHPDAAHSNAKPVRSDYWTRSVSHHEIRARHEARTRRDNRAITVEVREATPDDSQDAGAGEGQGPVEEERVWERIYA